MRVLFIFFVTGLLLSCGARSRTDGGAGLLPIGAQAPDVAGVDQNGTSHTLSEAKGSWTVVYFYPKDATPGCTKEACAFRDVWDRYQAADIRLFGVSKGSSKSHKSFATEHRLDFPLIADENEVWARAFGVSQMMGMYKRVTFIINGGGKVAKVYGDVDPGVHATQILTDIDALKTPKP